MSERDRQPAQYDLTDVTDRTGLHAEMNRHMAWIVNLAIALDAPMLHDRLQREWEFVAARIDSQAKLRRRV